MTDVAAVFSLADVTVTRGRAESHSHPLSHVRVTIAAGRCTAVVGPSGAGKSTLLRLLNRMDDASVGEVRFHDRPIASYDVLELRRRVGLVAQVPVLLGETVREELRVAVPDLADADARRLLRDVALDDAFLDRESASLSGGEAQRVCLARALTVHPEVLLLDEPTSALDAFAARAVEQVLARLHGTGLTTVLVSHDLDQARRLADDVVVVVGGSVVDAGPADRVFGSPAEPARAFLGGVS
jgi:putative ABC transport system ATP-binding protein